ncbi:MAG: hypothetical protein RIR70_460 [Pseudomonadota bacterium]|jgi:outer membrane protein assembly factor BamC
MKNPPAKLLVAITAAFAAGCSGPLLETKKIDYKSAETRTTPLEVPPDLTSPMRDDRFTVPQASAKGTATLSGYTAERSGARAAGPQEVLPKPDNMRIERAGSQRWLVVPGEPDKLWPNVREFWLDAGFILAQESPETGILETDWAENRAKLPQDLIRKTLGKVFDSLYSTSERDKFRTRLEKGAGGTTEIYVSHRGVMEVYANEAKDQTVWQPRPADPELEAEMLGRLMVRLGVDEQRAKAMLTAMPAEDRARLAKSADGSARLVVAEGFDRAWRRVGLALDRVGFTVEDRDRAQGVYFVRYVDPDAEAKSRAQEGVLSKMFSVFKSDTKPAKAGSQYRIHIKAQTDNSSNIQVLSKEGGVDKSESAEKILGLLFEQLK